MYTFGGNDFSYNTSSISNTSEASEKPKKLSENIYSKKFYEQGNSESKSYYSNKKAVLFKTEMCRSFTELGYCKYGKNCQFCHSINEQRKIKRHPKYKTEICKTFWEQGNCPYGRRCCFAHLENVELSNKSEVCLTNLSFDIDENSSYDIDSFDNIQPFVIKTTNILENENEYTDKIIFKQFIPKSNKIKKMYFQDEFKSCDMSLSKLKELNPIDSTVSELVQRRFRPIFMNVEEEKHLHDSIWNHNDMKIWCKDSMFYLTPRDKSYIIFDK